MMTGCVSKSFVPLGTKLEYTIQWTFIIVLESVDPSYFSMFLSYIIATQWYKILQDFQNFKFKHIMQF